MGSTMNKGYLIGTTRMIQRECADYAVVIKDYNHLSREVTAQVVDACRTTSDPDCLVAAKGTTLCIHEDDLHDISEYRQDLEVSVMQVSQEEEEIIEQALERRPPEKSIPSMPGNVGLPTDAAARKGLPVYSGFVKYFPRAMVAVAELSKIGNDQHNPGKPLHWDRSKSGDELDAAMRHLLEAGTIDTDGIRHSTKFAWRAMGNLEKELEKAEKDLQSQ